MFGTNVFGFFLNLSLDYFFIYGAASWDGMGLKGSALASVITSFAQLAVFWGYTCLWKGYHAKTWPGWSKLAFTRQQVKEFVSQSIPNAVTGLMDEGIYPAISLFIGGLGESAVAAQSVVWNIWTFQWALVSGISIAVMIRVAHYLGAMQISQVGLFDCVRVVCIYNWLKLGPEKLGRELHVCRSV